MKARADVLLSKILTSRSQLQRIAALSDIGLRHFENEGVGGAVAVKLVYDDSKMNKNGKLEVSGMLRHKSELECAVGALGFYLFSKKI